jgi:hypothetical protein
VTGKRAAAMPWSPSQEERRKAIFATLLQAVPLVVFDNIAAGAAISCPVIEQALTASEIEDRVLKESRTERAACATIMAFTGNNILPKGDLASRVLIARINVDRPDPENRDFMHPDPLSWTLGHRAEIISALYTVLAGNPRVREKPKKRAAAKTRFKPWWHLIGSAIEYAAGLTANVVDFGELFRAAEREDEDAASLAEALQCLDRRAGGKSFKSADVVKWTSAEDYDAQTLKSFFAHNSDSGLTARSIAWKLKAVCDAPVWVGEEIWTLRAAKNPNGNVAQFSIKGNRR